MGKRILTEEQRAVNKKRSQAWRDADPERARKSSVEASKKQRTKYGYTPWPAKRAVGLEVQELKANPCVDCGGTFPRECMDYDHRIGEIKVMGGVERRLWPKLLNVI
jgi:hypothetical protein